MLEKKIMIHSCIEYSLCADAMSYSLSHSADAGAKIDTNCVEDFLQIPGNYFELETIF